MEFSIPVTTYIEVFHKYTIYACDKNSSVMIVYLYVNS